METLEQQKHAEPATHQHNADHEEQVPTDLPRIRPWAVILIAVVVIAAFAGLFLLGWIPREHRLAEIENRSTSDSQAKPLVQVIQPKRIEKSLDLWLPADARANQETSIFPRANGYLKRLLVDIGDHVAAGQLLAEIETPDVDADLIQAKASVTQAQANLGKAQTDFELSKTTLQRYEGFAQGGGVTQQQLDEKRSAFTLAQAALSASTANVQVAEAAVQRLVAVQGFNKVVAPFAGTIAARNYDLGALMSPSNTADGKEMFRIADTSTLRVSVNVPQAYVTSLKVGQPAYLAVRNFPGKEFPGTISRSAGELDPATRTIRFQIDFNNQNGVLFAGMYAQVRLLVTPEQPPMVVPTSALVFDASGTRVWTVNGGQAHSKKVNLGRDFGTEVEIASGLEGDESVVTNPGLRIADGGEVQIAGDESPRQPQQALAR